jgi:multidrug efflux pump subunit AcrB
MGRGLMGLTEKYELGFTAKIVEEFLVSKLPIIFIIVCLVAGAAALLVTPREEEPQIVVPMIDVMVNFPGASAQEVENLVTINLERRLWEIDGVEYVYSTSRTGRALVTARFFVGEDREDSILKVHSKIQANMDKVPQGVTGWVIRPMEIDDTPIVTFALYSDKYGDYELRRFAEELVHRLQSIENTGATTIVGGNKRLIRVLMKPDQMAARSVGPNDIVNKLKAANANVKAGAMDVNNNELLVYAGPYIRSVEELGNIVISVSQGRPVFLNDIADIEDGPDPPQTYTRLGFGAGAFKESHNVVPENAQQGESYHQVTIQVAKRKGANAVEVARNLIDRVEELQSEILPTDVRVLVTRNYGETANHKVNELVKHLGIAIISIIALLTIMLGVREAMIVALAVPMTLGVTLLANYLVGYSINRVTLFALILSLGLLVDDPIVDVENIHRHFKEKRHPPLDATLLAVDEVRPPTILATLAVIVSFVPLFFITGMMGPYMAPMALNVPVAMIISLVVAFTVTPWTTYYALRHEYGKESEPYDFKTGAIYKFYKRIITPFLESGLKSFLFLGCVLLALISSTLLIVFNYVPVKMLPFDNKNEFLILVDMPEGTSLEVTDQVARDIEDYLATVNEVRDFETFVGVAAPIDFNGLVRHYYLREGANVADIRVNLIGKEERVFQSHGLVLRLRPDLDAIARKHGAIVKLVEVPPGPPVLATLVAEVYGPPEASYQDLIRESQKVKDMMASVDKVVDVDDTVEADQTRLNFSIDRVKTGLAGMTERQVASAARIFLGGVSPTLMHEESERTPLEINVRLPRELRSRPEDMGLLRVRSADGAMVPFNELGRLEETTIDKSIYRKNLERVVFVQGEMAGRSPVNAIFDLKEKLNQNPLPPGYKVNLAGEGEWDITLDVFRDLGIAFAAALLLIYILLVQQTESFLIPLVIMVAIPLTLIGILPGFALLNWALADNIGQYQDSIFFTATSMIGMIALAGIVVRNSIILIDFIHVRLDKGFELEEAIIDSAAVRFTPIFLTAAAAIFGSWVITLDPVFSGLAWAFIFGIFASTIFTLVVVPIIYYLIYKPKPGA